MLDFPFLNQVLHRSRHVLDGHVRVNPVLVEKVDDVGSEPLERGLGHLLDMFGATVQYRCTLCSPGIDLGVKAELGGDHHLPTEGRERLSDQFFVCERSIHFGGIEKCDTAFNG